MPKCLVRARSCIEPAIMEYLERRIARRSRRLRPRGRSRRVWWAAALFFLQNSLKVYVGRTEALGRPGDPGQEEGRGGGFPHQGGGQSGVGEGLRRGVGGNRPRGGGDEAGSEAADLRRTDSQLFSIAQTIVEYVAEIRKPDGERLPGFHDAGLDALRFQFARRLPFLRRRKSCT